MAEACAPVPVLATSVLERRLAAEWTLLEKLAKNNQGRLTDLSAEDLRIRVTLRKTRAFSLAGEIMNDHPLRIDFPAFFPAAPMELSLDRPVQHPNVHPETGFVCLWDRHRSGNTVEHALHKTVAILGWRLWNDDPAHVMQAAAIQRMREAGPEQAALLGTPGLTGIAPATPAAFDDAGARRRRLS